MQISFCPRPPQSFRAQITATAIAPAIRKRIKYEGPKEGITQSDPIRNFPQLSLLLSTNPIPNPRRNLKVKQHNLIKRSKKKIVCHKINGYVKRKKKGQKWQPQQRKKKQAVATKTTASKTETILKRTSSKKEIWRLSLFHFPRNFHLRDSLFISLLNKTHLLLSLFMPVLVVVVVVVLSIWYVIQSPNYRPFASAFWSLVVVRSH